MKNTQDRLRRIKVDALYGKKKHFNAADRKEKLHYKIGVPLITINVITSSVLICVICDGASDWVKYVPLALTLVATLLSGFQTYLKLQQKVEGHRRVGNRYLATVKRCDRLQAYVADSIVSSGEFVKQIEEISSEIDDINQEAEAYPSSSKDYRLAKEGIESGEEFYTEEELNI